jgi:hypothetical protein
MPDADEALSFRSPGRCRPRPLNGAPASPSAVSAVARHLGDRCRRDRLVRRRSLEPLGGAIRFEANDDAYTVGDITPLAAKVSGYVAAVGVTDYQTVRKTRLLTTPGCRGCYGGGIWPLLDGTS